MKFKNIGILIVFTIFAATYFTYKITATGEAFGPSGYISTISRYFKSENPSENSSLLLAKNETEECRCKVKGSCKKKKKRKYIKKISSTRKKQRRGHPFSNFEEDKEDDLLIVPEEETETDSYMGDNEDVMEKEDIEEELTQEADAESFT